MGSGLFKANNEKTVEAIKMIEQSGGLLSPVMRRQRPRLERHTYFPIEISIFETGNSQVTHLSSIEKKKH